MVGDLISILILSLVWWRILRLRKKYFGDFIFELSIYLFSFWIALVFYKFINIFFSFFFDFGLFPSVVGIFALGLALTYISLKLFIYWLERKGKLTSEKKQKIIEKEVIFFQFVAPTEQNFQKAFTAFFIINLVVILTLFNSFFDVFTHQRILSYENSSSIDSKAERLIENAQGSETGRENLSNTIHFLKVVDPKSYEKIVQNTNGFIFSEKSMYPVLGLAHVPEGYIEIDPLFSRPFNSVEDEIYFASLLIHESEHLKNFREDDGFIVNVLNYGYLGLKCNPATNYQYFSDIKRSIFAYGDEWCAQVSEVKFLRQFNVDYEEDWIKYFEDNE